MKFTLPSWINRRKRFSSKIDYLLTKKTFDKEEFISLFEEMEKENLLLIQKLSRKRVVTEKRIAGALNQTFDAHPNFNRNLIGSAVKRIYGTITSSAEPIKKKPIKKETVLFKVLKKLNWI